MDSGRSNEIKRTNSTLLTYTLPADGQGEGECGRSFKTDVFARSLCMVRGDQ